MANLGFSKEEMMAALDSDGAVISSITRIEAFPAIPETTDEPLALPEPVWEKEEVTQEEDKDSINSEEQEESKETVSAPEPEEPSVEETDEELVSLEDPLSDDPEYRAYYAPEHPKKKSSRTLPTMDELLSGGPINMILCMGKLVPKGADFSQHTRVCHADGIIPTETATGSTYIYTPPAPSVAA